MQNTALQVILNKKEKINQSSLKIIACIVMLLSHFVMCYSWQGWGIIKGKYTGIFEMLGQISFPLFSFGIVCSWEKSRHKKQYLKNILLLSIISQVPYTMALYPSNLQKIDCESRINYFNIIWLYLIVYLVIFSGFYLVDFLKKEDYKIFILVSIMSCYNLCFQYIWFNYTDNLNIAYLFWASIGIFSIIEKWNQFSLFFKIWETFCIILMVIFIISRSDHGILGFCLIIILYLFRKKLKLQCVCVTIWGILVYGCIYKNIYNTISSVIASLILNRYNGERGKIPKKVFYILYPAHLFIMGMINIFLKTMK